MARFAYFADLPSGQTLEWRDRTEHYGTTNSGKRLFREVAAKVGMFSLGQGNVLCGHDETLGRVAITRKVEMKSSPSRHDCDARCMNASGWDMACECACGGKNHGRGAFNCEAA